jgi:hypothetical protein
MRATSANHVELLEPPDGGSLRDVVEPFLDNFHQSWPCGALEWILRPMLHERFRGAIRRPTLPRHAGLASHVVAAQMRRRGVQVLSQGHVLFAIDGTNLRRVLEPLIETRTADMGDPFRLVSMLDRRRLWYWTKLATRYADALIHAAERADIPVAGSEVRRYCLGGARALARAEAIIQEGHTHLLVVATQHASNIRALLATARRKGVTSLYFPHAPVAANRQYADLPVDYAGLRGQGEVDLYRGLGVSGDLPVVGNPAVSDFVESGPLILKEAIVFAVSTHPPAVLADLIRLTASVLGKEDVVVAPHPRSDRKELIRLMPSSWRLSSEGSTFDLLRKGPKVVIQHSSGIAWEALALGIPVIQLSYLDAPANYPLISPPYVPFAHSTASLMEAVTEATRRATHGNAREELRDWAALWCSSVGRDARLACVDLIGQVQQMGQRPDVLLDGWRLV